MRNIIRRKCLVAVIAGATLTSGLALSVPQAQAMPRAPHNAICFTHDQNPDGSPLQKVTFTCAATPDQEWFGFTYCSDGNYYEAPLHFGPGTENITCPDGFLVTLGTDGVMFP
jgi:hypothetical protein